MQAILFLLGLFAIGCVLYGISAGVQLIRRGVSGLLQGARHVSTHGRSAPAGDAAARISPPVASRNQAPGAQPPASSPVQHGIGELRALFALYQQEALIAAEFEGLKRAVLASMAARPARSGQA